MATNLSVGSYHPVSYCQLCDLSAIFLWHNIIGKADMSRAVLTIGFCAVIVASLWLLPNRGSTQGSMQDSPSTQDGVAAFERIASVLQSPRCMNCHPRSDRPSQGNDRHTHLMNVQRGPNDRGLPAMGCVTCHQEHNNDRAGVPGAPHWHLAPKSMGWTGLSLAALCRTLLDPKKNGGRSVTALATHMTTDKLVLWAWQPGVGRMAPPLSQDDLKHALDLWAKAGAPCPN
jgi:hypothetical protein